MPWPECLDATLWFSQRLQSTPPPTAAETFAASSAHRPSVWRGGAALDLSGSTAAGRARARAAPSCCLQWIMLTQEAGSNPPQETGLMLNSWYGKFHLEMRWHHHYHFHLWGAPRARSVARPTLSARAASRRRTRGACRATTACGGRRWSARPSG